MQPLMKIDLEKALDGDQPVIIELGCGKKKKQDRISIDKVNLPGVDIVADLEEGLAFLPDGSVDEIHCRSVLEHIANFETLMADMVRVLKPGGKCLITFFLSIYLLHALLLYRVDQDHQV